MDIIKYDVYRNPNLGVYTRVNDSFVFVPNGFAPTKAQNLTKYLDVDCIYCSIANTRLLGPLMVVNNNAILLPKTATEEEYNHLKETTGLDIHVLDVKHNALGNLICLNDKGAVVSPIIPKETAKNLGDILGIEVFQKRIAGYIQVGALMVVNNSGGVIHPETDEEDIKQFSNVLGIKIEPATINGGVPFLASGILANNKGIVVGSLTNGPEIMMLTRAFLN